MYKTIQKSLLILFVLLQCMSPLAHAHVYGIDGGQQVYSHDLSAYEPMSESHVENDEGAVIVMPHAYPAGEIRFILDEQPALLSGLPADIKHRLFQPISAVRFIFHHTRSNYVLAWSQAPPSNILQA
jgi:hypothetical protein